MKSPDGQENTAKRGRLAMRKELAYEIPVRAVERGLAPMDPLKITTFLHPKDSFFRHSHAECVLSLLANGSPNRLHRQSSEIESQPAPRLLRKIRFRFFRSPDSLVVLVSNGAILAVWIPFRSSREHPREIAFASRRYSSISIRTRRKCCCYCRWMNSQYEQTRSILAK